MNELRESAVCLTRVLYRVSERFPEHEPLRRHCRGYADDILAGVVEWDEPGKRDWIVGRIDTLREWLLVAFAMQWVAPVNIEVLIREYTLLRDRVEQKILREPREQAYGKQQEQELDSRPVDNNNRGTQKESTAAGAAAGTVRPLADVAESKVNAEVNERQRKIMERLAEAGRVKISDFYDTFNAISSKTIQRDLQDLTTRNIIKKAGEKRWTTYMLA